MEEIKKIVLESVGIEPTKENIKDSENAGYLTINGMRNGHYAVWYYDGNKESCYDVNEKKFLSASEIEKQLDC